MKTLGIVRETKNKWEKRVPLNPDAVSKLVAAGNKVIIQPSNIRIYNNEEYIKAGAEVNDDLHNADLILGVKEIPINEIIPKIPYLFFSHTVKGQKYNMPLLQRFLDTNTTLYDYELIKNAQGQRLVFFGKFAGNAGFIDTLWGLGQRLDLQFGIKTPFTKVKRAYEYETVQAAIEHIKEIGFEISEKGLPGQIKPLNIFLMGYGHVATGCREIMKALPINLIDPDELIDKSGSDINLYVFQEKHMVERKDGLDFDLQDYFSNGSKYRSRMEKYLPECSVYLNAIYWESGYPVFLPRSTLKSLQVVDPKLIIIGDITCDINGSVEATVKATDPDNPIYVYNAITGEIKDGILGEGFADCAVDNFPCEFSREASDFFTSALMPFINSLLNYNHRKPISETDLPEEIKKSCLTHHGKLMPDYEFLYDHLKE